MSTKFLDNIYLRNSKPGCSRRGSRESNAQIANPFCPHCNFSNLANIEEKLTKATVL